MMWKRRKRAGKQFSKHRPFLVIRCEKSMANSLSKEQKVVSFIFPVLATLFTRSQQQIFFNFVIVQSNFTAKLKVCCAHSWFHMMNLWYHLKSMNFLIIPFMDEIPHKNGEMWNRVRWNEVISRNKLRLIELKLF